jgi:predicted metal-dependent phosphoesterase TrpH
MVDLHTHSTQSDGTFAPAALIQKAASEGLCALALTDHDTVDGLAEAEQAARTLGLRFIPGIELEINNNTGECHLLGLGLDRNNGEIIAAAALLKKAREERNMKILERMRDAGISADYADIRSLSGGGCVGRPHFARYLVQVKAARNVMQAFDKFLARNRPFYVPREGLDFEFAVNAVHSAGALAVLAHPASLYLSWGKLPDAIAALRERGLDGIEAWHPAATPNTCRRFVELGRSLGLLITASSDFHGENRPDRKLGRTSGGIKIDDSFLQAFDLWKR